MKPCFSARLLLHFYKNFVIIYLENVKEVMMYDDS